MPPIRDIDLMLLADGELEPAERAELEAAAAADPDARAKLEGLDDLGEVLRGHLELAADDEKRLGGMWAEIDKRLELDAGKRKSTAMPAVPAQPAGPGAWARLSRWIDTYRGHVLTGVLSAGAVAAIALVTRQSSDQLGVKQDQVASTPGPTAGTGDVPEVVPVVLEKTAAKVESLEVSGGTGTVFTIQGEDGEETTVIWVTPDDTVEGI